jgi:hypothetical protein
VLASNLNNVQLSVSNLTNKVITNESQIKLLQNNQTLISESISTTIENLDTINQELIDLNKKVANISQYGNNSIYDIPIHINNLENGDILIYNGSV